MNNFVNPRGDTNSPLAFLGYQPSEEDEGKGIAFMDTAGWFLDKLIMEAQLPVPFLATLQPLASMKLPDQMCIDAIKDGLRGKPIIITCDSRRERGEKTFSDVLNLLVPDTHGNLDKYAGSLLRSPHFDWEHYLIPTQSPQYIFENYSEKDIVVSIDYSRAKEEMEFWLKHGKLQPLPERELITEPTFPELIGLLKDCRKAEYLSTDIETIRPTDSLKKKSEIFRGHPGYPYTNSFATSPKFGFSYSFWDYDLEQLTSIWREMDWLLRNIPQIGQNYFSFDIQFLEALGFRPCLKRCVDTLIRHHILWPELPHSLQFQTRQYTRQPYYKDEGKGWKPSQKKQLCHYNALDTTVTYEVFLGQEEEFGDRPWLK